MRLTILTKYGNKRGKIFLSALGMYFNSTKFQSKSAAFFFPFSTYYTSTSPSEAQTESPNSTGIFRQYNLCHRERIQSEDTTVLCCCFRNFSQFINTKHSPFSACSFSKCRCFPYLAQKVKNQNCLKVKYFFKFLKSKNSYSIGLWKVSCHSVVHHKHYVVDIHINGLTEDIMLYLGRMHTKHLLLSVTIPHLNSFSSVLETVVGRSKYSNTHNSFSSHTLFGMPSCMCNY